MFYRGNTVLGLITDVQEHCHEANFQELSVYYSEINLLGANPGKSSNPFSPKLRVYVNEPF